MRFDLFGLIFMVVCLRIGAVITPMVEEMFGLVGLFATVIIGFIVYGIYTMLTGARFGMFPAIIFIVGMIVAGFGTEYIGAIFDFSMFAEFSEWVVLFVEAVILSVVLSFISPKQQVPVKV